MLGVAASWVLVNTFLNFAGRIFLSRDGCAFPAPFVYTECHMLACILYAAVVVGRRREKSALVDAPRAAMVDHLGVFLALGFCNGLSIALNNTSLRYLSVGLNQIIKACVPLPTAVLQRLVLSVPITTQQATALLLVVSGAVVVCGGLTPSPTVSWGILAAVASALLTALRSTLAAKMLRGGRFDVEEVLLYESLVSLVVLAPFAASQMRDFWVYSRIWWNMPDAIVGLLLTSAAAVLYNHLTLRMVRSLLPTTVNLLSTVRQAALIVIAAATEGDFRFTVHVLVGLVDVLTGSLAYLDGGASFFAAWERLDDGKALGATGITGTHTVKRRRVCRGTCVVAATLGGMIGLSVSFRALQTGVIDVFRHRAVFANVSDLVPTMPPPVVPGASWVTSCNDAYVPGVLKLKASLDRVQSAYPLVAMTFDVSNASLQLLRAAGVEARPVNLSAIFNPFNPYWTPGFAKLEAWTWVEHRRLAWLDSDMVVLQNMDEVLALPVDGKSIAAPLDAEVWAADGAETPSFKMIQSGMFVFVPSLETYREMQRAMRRLPSYDSGDQGFLTSFFAQNGFNASHLLSSAYDYMKVGLYRDPHFDLQRIKALHFVMHPKPWEGHGAAGYEPLQAIWDAIPGDLTGLLHVPGRSWWWSASGA